MYQATDILTVHFLVYFLSRFFFFFLVQLLQTRLCNQMATQLSNAIHQALGTNGPFHSTVGVNFVLSAHLCNVNDQGSPPSGLPSDSSESLQSQAKASGKHNYWLL
jgi:hypothetical protein